MKKRLLKISTVLFCIFFTLGITACTAILTDLLAFPEPNPVIIADGDPVVSPDQEDKTVYVSDEKVLKAVINEDGQLIITPLKSGTAEVSFFDFENDASVVYEFKVTSKGELIENSFRKTVRSYLVIIQNAPGGTIETSKTSAHAGETITVTVTPQDGYNFGAITVRQDQTPVALSGNNTFTMPKGDVTVSATFNPLEYKISFGTMTNGTVTADKTTGHTGETIILTASPNDGYQFEKYTVTSGGQNITVTDNTFTMPAGNVTVSATFVVKEYSISLSSSLTNGTVTADKTSAHAGEPITLTATPAQGYQFKEYNVTSDGQTVTVNINKFTMPKGDVIVSATFAAIDYTVSVDNDIEHGSVTADKTTAHIGDVITLTATPADGYQFEKYTVTSGGQSETVRTNTFTMPAGNVTVSATFTVISYTVSISSTPNGTVTASKTSANVDEIITLTATPDNGYNLVGFTVTSGGQDIEVKDNSFKMPAGNVTVSATFATGNYTISVASNIEHGSVTADKTTAHFGDVITLTATPANGYQFGEYSVTSGGQTVTLSGNDTFTMPAGDVTVSATFTAIGYSITLPATITGGTVTASKSTASVGEEITLTATPSAGYNFGAFTVTSGGQTVTLSANNTFTMPAGNVTVSATFTAIDYTVSVAAMTNGSVTTNKTTAHAGETVTLTVAPSIGYQLATLSVKDSSNATITPAVDPSDSTKYTFTMPDTIVSVTATFESVTCSVGDVLLNTGTIIPHANVNTMTDGQKAAAVGVLYDVDDEGNPRGWLGLYNSADGTNSGKYKWAPSGTTGYDTNFKDIVCTTSAATSKSGAASTATFTGDTDGSDNWAYICSQDSSGASDAAKNYPAFNYVNNYASTFKLTGDYATGWYMPSLAELCYIYRNKDVLNSVLTALGGIQLLENASYWSSSQRDDDYRYPWSVFIGQGVIYNHYGKYYDLRVCCVHKFSFSADSLQNYPVSISTMTNGSVTTDKATAHAGETVTLTVAPSTGYPLSTLSVKDSSNAKITITKDPSDSTKYTFTMPDTIVKVSAIFGEKGYVVGDVLLNDNTVIYYEDVAYMTADQKAAAVGVLYALDENGTPRGWLGLHNSAGGTESGKYAWAERGSTGSDTKFEDIVCTPSVTGSRAASTATFTGDTDGSNNWDYICSQDSSGASDAATNYPAFNYVNNYASTFNLTGDYATGWYMPSLAELCYIYRNKDVLNSVLEALGIQLNGWYWSSSQYSNNDYAWFVSLDYGDIDNYLSKDVDLRVCCVRAF